MIGFYNYTMILTYSSLMSAGLGIVFSLADSGHPYIGMFFLLFCGLCDAFDGKVARTKKNRTEEECRFGVQIDSLSDVVAFGVLPVCIGVAVIRRSEFINSLMENAWGIVFTVILFAIMIMYLLAAMIRLAYFNVMEEMRRSSDSDGRKYYVGLPVTSAAIVFPTMLLVQYLVQKFASIDVSFIYFIFG